MCRVRDEGEHGPSTEGMLETKGSKVDPGASKTNSAVTLLITRKEPPRVGLLPEPEQLQGVIQVQEVDNPLAKQVDEPLIMAHMGGTKEGTEEEPSVKVTKSQHFLTPNDSLAYGPVHLGLRICRNGRVLAFKQNYASPEELRGI